MCHQTFHTIFIAEKYVDVLLLAINPDKMQKNWRCLLFQQNQIKDAMQQLKSK